MTPFDTCPKCHAAVVSGKDGGECVKVCLACQLVLRPLSDTAVALKPLVLSPLSGKLTEAQVQTQIVAALHEAGYEVLETNEHRRRCTECGSFSHTGSGITKGIGDLLFRRASWTPCVWGMLEVKTLTGSVKREQRQREQRQGLAIVRSVEEARHYAQQLHQQLGGEK